LANVDKHKIEFASECVCIAFKQVKLSYILLTELQAMTFILSSISFALPSTTGAIGTMNPPDMPDTPDLDGRRSPGSDCMSRFPAVLRCTVADNSYHVHRLLVH